MGQSTPIGQKPHSGPARPAGEEARLAELARTALLDTEPEPEFDRITRLVTAALDVPMAAVTLIDRDRQWFKSAVGLSRRETPREEAFCSHVVDMADAMVVPDASLDPRFADNPSVLGDPNVRFYLGQPLRTSSGFTLGALCAIDRVAREATPREVAIMRGLAELVVEQIELRLAANTDGLTRAIQRTAFLEQASRDFVRARRASRPLSCLLLDTDRFKTINDTFGHAAGDAVLRAVVSRCQAALRETDYIGRLGGEEFCVMLPDAELPEAFSVAERVRLAIASEPITADAHTMGITVSIGLASIRDDDESVSDMIGRSDHAMYEAKIGGRNQCRPSLS